MPPVGVYERLTPDQVAKLKRWIEQGAEYPPHWAFVTPKRPTPPNTKHQTQNAIDAFIFARLEKEGLAPSKEADKAALLRRVTLDLTGLLPAPKEVEDFLKDDSPGAYEKVVDRLLASPHYGERQAADTGLTSPATPTATGTPSTARGRSGPIGIGSSRP